MPRIGDPAFLVPCMLPHHFAFLVLVNFTFALALVVVKVAMGDMPPLLFTGLRFFLLAIVLIPFLEWHSGQMRDIVIVAMGAGGIQFSLFYSGIYIADDLSSVVVASQLGVPFTTLLSMVLLGEYVGWRRWIGMAFAFGGVMIFMFDPRVFGYLDGMLFGIGAALISAVTVIVMRRLKDVPVFQLQAWIAMLSWPLLFPLSLAIEGDMSVALVNAGWESWAGVVFAAFISNLVAHAGLYYLIQRYEVSLISPLTLMTPIFAIILGVTLLSDELTARMLFGGAVALFGVLIVSLRRPDDAEKAEAIR